MAIGANMIAASGIAPFFKLANGVKVGIGPPVLRRGDGLTTWLRSFSGFQKEALVASARTGELSRAELKPFLIDAITASPLNGLCRGQLTSRFALARNGAELQPDKVAPLGAPIYPDPGAGRQYPDIRRHRLLFHDPVRPICDHVEARSGPVPHRPGHPFFPGRRIGRNRSCR